MTSEIKSPWDNKKDDGAIKNNNEQKQKTENKNSAHEDADFDQFFKKLFTKKEKVNNEKSGEKSKKPVIGIAILGVILLWLSFGFYKVDADENAVVLYFGKFYKITTSGLNYNIPYPFGKVIKQSVTRVNTEEFGFTSASLKNDKNRNFEAESLMLTGDENIVDIEFQVQWQVSDVKDFVFNIASQNETIRKSAESAIREIIARTPIVDALSDKKSKIETETKELLQQILNSYKAGVRVVLVQLRRVDPPAQVIDAFRDVQTAKADKEKEINEAQSYANDIIPRARGTASQMLEQAQAYKKEVISNAEGEAGRFSSVYGEYLKSKQVTKKRLYLETMEKVYRDTDKVLIDSGVSITPYFPISEFNKTESNKK